MDNNLYDSLPQGLREALDQMGESEVAKQIYAELAKWQAKVYAEKEKAKEAVEKFKSEFTKAMQKENNDNK